MVTSPSFNLHEPPEQSVSSKSRNDNDGEDSRVKPEAFIAVSDPVGEAMAEELQNIDGDDLTAIEERLRSASLTGSLHEMENDIQQVKENLSEEDDEDSQSFEDAKEMLSPQHQLPPDQQLRRSSSKENSPSKEELSLTSEWRYKPKHMFILSDAGKPIYSLHGDEDELSSLMAVMQATVSFVQDLGDNIRAVRTADTTIVFLNKKPLILAAVSHGSESVTQLIVQLTYLYHQVLSVLTQTQLSRIFEQKKGYDLRRMLAGSERLLDSLANSMETDPSYMLSAVRVLPMAPATREVISSTIINSCTKVKNLVFALLIADNRLISLVRMKKYFIHPADLHLIFNLVHSSESFKLSESWTPLCLPKFDSSGFMHAHVSYLSDESPACLMLLTIDKENFFELSEARRKIVQGLEKSGSIKAIDVAVDMGITSPEDAGVPEIKHFIYKSKGTAQFTTSDRVPPYSNNDKARTRLQNLYLILKSRLHSPSRPLKLVYYSGPYENVIAWAQQTFEVYATFDPLMTKAKAIASINKLLKWVKKEENSLFIHTAPSFN